MARQVWSFTCNTKKNVKTNLGIAAIITLYKKLFLNVWNISKQIQWKGKFEHLLHVKQKMLKPIVVLQQWLHCTSTEMDRPTKKKRTLRHLKKNHLHPITRMKTKNQIIICNLWEWINDKLPFQVIYTPPLIPFSHRPKRISNMKPLISYEMTIIASPECIVPLSSPSTYPKFTFTIS